MQTVQIKLAQGLDLQLPDRADILNMAVPQKIADPEAAIRHALCESIDIRTPLMLRNSVDILRTTFPSSLMISLTVSMNSVKVRRTTSLFN